MTEINLNDIVSNSDNTREAAPKLQALGYGVVEPIEGTGKESLFNLALGTPDDKRRFVALVEQHDEGLVDLALSIQERGQLQNCRVRLLDDGQYALTFGARRSLAILFLHAKNGIPATVMATVSEADAKTAVIESAAENMHLPPSYIDQGKLFKRLQEEGMTINEIAKVCPMGKASDQNIRHRIRLLELPLEDQLKVHHGVLSQDNALKLLKKMEETSSGEESNPTIRSGKGKAGIVGKMKQKKPEGKVAERDELQAALQDFIDRITAIGLDTYSPADSEEVLRLTNEARTWLSVVKKKASKGKQALAR